MSEPTTRTEFHLIQLLPNLLTVAAICAGMTAIRFGVDGNYLRAVQLILFAAVLDGLDGRLARLLNADSTMGAELDSLADFLNFGVAPVFVLYYWVLQDVKQIAWIAALIYALCCVIRLARFNVAKKSDDEDDGEYFTGVPSPAGALLVMLPMFISFGLEDAPDLPGILLCIHMVAIGLLMISPVRIWSFKSTKISRENVKFFLIGMAIVGVAVLTFAWITLSVLCLAYIGLIAWSAARRMKPQAQDGA
jgi:CDP-diacylglycerol--serine O-phosphatidyltransferase